MNNFEEIEKSLPVLESIALIYEHLGADEATLSIINNYRSSIIDYRKQKDLPRKFNNIFEQAGWIATDEISVPLMEEAIKIFNDRDLESAEKLICDKFTNEFFETKITRMNALFVFEGRDRLIRLAYEDHKNKRYHASIPVILSQIDGLLFDIAGHSFFENEKNIEKLSYTSRLTGLKTDLNLVAKRMNKHRGRTRAIPLQFPYRNGILHGRELFL